jgi:hypothetical protein
VNGRRTSLMGGNHNGEVHDGSDEFDNKTIMKGQKVVKSVYSFSIPETFLFWLSSLLQQTYINF